MTIADSDGCHLVGYFSKVSDSYNKKEITK